LALLRITHRYYDTTRQSSKGESCHHVREGKFCTVFSIYYQYSDILIVPHISTTIVRHYTGETGPTPENLQLWKSVLPAGNGLVQVEDPKAYGLPAGLLPLNGTGAVYSVTWAHEYHCIDMIREEFWKFIAGSSHLVGSDDTGSNLPERDRLKLRHIGHCFDYLRQMIMCNADMTLEGLASKPAESGGGDHIDGFDVEHQCKDMVSSTQ
jgi:hypothetical protein